MTHYIINYNTGITDVMEFDEPDLLAVMRYAEARAEYTQQDIDIYQDGRIIATLKWYGIAPCDDDIVAVDFQDFGFYAWLDL